MDAVIQAISRRIQYRHTDLIDRFGFLEVMEAIECIAHYVGDVEEIGTSDVSCWVKSVVSHLELLEGAANRFTLEDAVVHLFSR